MTFRQFDTTLTGEKIIAQKSFAKREQNVLSAIIEEHLATGEPVGSKTLAEKFARISGMSAATIRNVMSELEEAGFVVQPHTSAGRIPTDKGYRFYVDNLLGVLPISNEDYRLINSELGFSPQDSSIEPEKLLEKTSQLLSILSNNVGIVISPSLEADCLQHIKFVNLADKRILVILVSSQHQIHQKIVRLDSSLTQDELDRISNYLNTEFAGKSLTAIRQNILIKMHEERAVFDKHLQTAMILCSESLTNDDATADIYIGGASNIVDKPDFSTDLAKLRELLRTIEEKSRLVQILNECIKRNLDIRGGVNVIIGGENSSPSLQNCALITAPYRFGAPTNAVGTLTVLGPTRIEYARLIAIVSYLANLFEKISVS